MPQYTLCRTNHGSGHNSCRAEACLALAFTRNGSPWN